MNTRTRTRTPAVARTLYHRDPNDPRAADYEGEGKLLTGSRAAAVLGVSKSTFYKWIGKQIPSVEIGGTTWWSRKAIDTWVDRISGSPEAGEAW